jgi:N-acetylmuramic acid 6-phosphate (MurNAc-6-P) etherase
MFLITFVEKGHLLNPIVGPEPITGSSRMKGGTTTKMLLEAMFLPAHQLATNDPTPFNCRYIMKSYKDTLELTHTKDAGISSLIEMAGDSLIGGGSVLYLGWDSLGIMSMIDAAECVPTFGADHDDIRCFLKDGYELLNNIQGDLSSEGEKFQIGFNYFIAERCPKISEKDTVIFIVQELSLEKERELGEIAELVRKQNGNLAIIQINTNDKWQQQEYKLGSDTLNIHIALPEIVKSSNIYNKFLFQCTTEVSLKWVINAVSTGAHVLKGKVFKNFMIDLKLSNKKLFERGVRIVAQFGNIKSEEATKCLLKSIYRQDLLTSSIVKADVSTHVKVASRTERVIPLAILFAKGFNVDFGLKMLEDCPIVRQCIDNCL